MKGYVANKGARWYAVIYDGLDPVTGRERRNWHPAGTDRADARRLAARRAAEVNGRSAQSRGLSFGAYLTRRWLPARRLALRPSTYDGYRRKIERQILPRLGAVALRRLRPEDLEGLYDGMLHPVDGGRPLAPKTVLEVHLIIRRALGDAVRKGLVSRNVALVAAAPKLRAIPKPEQRAWSAPQLRAFLVTAAGHRLFPAFWLAAMTGMRRSELLGLRWDDIDLDAATLSVNRGLVAVAYQLHETRGKTRTTRRTIDLDATTVAVLACWHAWQHAERAAVGADADGFVFSEADGRPIHPHAISQAFERLVARARVPAIRFHDLRHTHATLLIKAAVPVKVVSERLGHATPAFTIETYQHVLPGMQAEAARIFETLVREDGASTGSGR